MKKWRFLSYLSSIIYGINDAGIETFMANLIRSLVREAIQNSLDAVLNNCLKPVEIEFHRFDIRREEIPDVESLYSSIVKCNNSNKDEPNAFKFFRNAEKVLSQPLISVLRISDHNTKGLEGSDTCAKGTNWSRLVKESGSSNKGQGSGGSFGIGKAAAFVCSDFRTVFYSSKDVKGLDSNFGVAKLVSFEDKGPGDWTTGIGYYSENEKFVAIHEMADFDKSYVRTDSGTDIYILGMHPTENFEDEFIKAVLLDFLVSIVTNKLVVRIQDKIIDQKTLPIYMAKLNPYEGDEIRDLQRYYHLLTSPDPGIKKFPLDASVYGHEHGFKDGECTLYLQEGEGFNRRIMVTRRAGMRILEMNRISGSIEFTGVLIIEGDTMSEAFKQMEVPSHDAWEPGRVRGEEKKYKKILDGLKKYLRDVVKECFGKAPADAMDAFGANEFLPDDASDENDMRLRKDEMSTRIRALTEKTVVPTKAKTRAIDLMDPDDEDLEYAEEDGDSGKKRRNSKKQNGGSTTNPDEKEKENRSGYEEKSFFFFDHIIFIL